MGVPMGSGAIATEEAGAAAAEASGAWAAEAALIFGAMVARRREAKLPGRAMYD